MTQKSLRRKKWCEKKLINSGYPGNFSYINENDESKNNIAQKEYKTRPDWVGKVIYSDWCLKLDHTNKWFMYKPEFLQENETH